MSIISPYVVGGSALGDPEGRGYVRGRKAANRLPVFSLERSVKTTVATGNSAGLSMSDDMKFLFAPTALASQSELVFTSDDIGNYRTTIVGTSASNEGTARPSYMSPDGNFIVAMSNVSPYIKGWYRTSTVGTWFPLIFNVNTTLPAIVTTNGSSIYVVADAPTYSSIVICFGGTASNNACVYYFNRAGNGSYNFMGFITDIVSGNNIRTHSIGGTRVNSLMCLPVPNISVAGSNLRILKFGTSGINLEYSNGSLPQVTGSIYAVAMSGDASTLFLLMNDNTLYVFKADSGGYFNTTPIEVLNNNIMTCQYLRSNYDGSVLLNYGSGANHVMYVAQQLTNGKYTCSPISNTSIRLSGGYSDISYDGETIVSRAYQNPLSSNTGINFWGRK